MLGPIVTDASTFNFLTALGRTQEFACLSDRDSSEGLRNHNGSGLLYLRVRITWDHTGSYGRTSGAQVQVLEQSCEHNEHCRSPPRLTTDVGRTGSRTLRNRQENERTVYRPMQLVPRVPLGLA
jgi:hypothetical protein